MDDIRKLQLTQLYIMKDIAEICEQNDITYYLCGGSLLGAIRHNGFIPWDDDLDITMYRNELKKLTDVIKEKYSEKYFIQNFETDSKYTRYITKIRLNGTSQVEKRSSDDNIHHGIYIDIFPLDHVTKSDGLGLKIRGKLLRLLFALKTAQCSKHNTATNIKKAILKCVRPVSRLIPSSFVNDMFDWVCTATDKPGAKYTTSFASHYLWKKQLVENEVYGCGEKHKFENCEFTIPSNYKALLNQVFGADYMQLPPEDKRLSGHTLVKIDLGKYECDIEKLAVELDSVN